MTSGVYSQISSNIEYLSLKDKWDQLRDLYSGVSGSTMVFNDWIVLTQAQLDESQPMGPQLTKLNKTRVNLANVRMGITDTQYWFILLHALPDSFNTLVSTILVSGDPTHLNPVEIVARIINEEGCRTSGSASLNAIAPIKGKGKGKSWCQGCR
jgi:hypothetical protein